MASRRADKWVHDVQPDDLVSQAAKNALRNRLRYLWSQLKLAAKQPEKNLEYVHQTRVASRRAIAALDTFAELLPKKRSKKIHKAVRKIRKAAGSARDDDVLLLRLGQLIEANAAPGLEEWRTEVEYQRKLHQAPIVEIYEHLHQASFKLRLKQLIKKIHWRESSDEPTYRTAAIRMLQSQYATFQPILSGDVPPEEELHPLRIAGKQLRYELELFAAAFPDGCIRQGIYPTVSKLQEMLGEVNDRRTSIARIEDWKKQAAGATEGETLQHLIIKEQEGLEAAKATFHGWWDSGSAAGLLESLRKLVEAEAGTCG